MTKYQDLKNEVKRSWKLKNAKVVPVTVGAMRIMMKNVTEILKTIPGNIITNELQFGSCPGLRDNLMNFDTKRLHSLVHES